jgi:hypothetical protein
LTKKATASSVRRWTPGDRFYDGYSFSMHFGYAPQDEYRRIEAILENAGWETPTNELVKIGMDCINVIASEAKRVGLNEIEKIDTLAKQERTVGGDIPTTIMFGWDMLYALAQYAMLGMAAQSGKHLGNLLIDKLKSRLSGKARNDVGKAMNDEMLKLAEKMLKDEKSSKVLADCVNRFTVRMGNKQIIDVTNEKRISTQHTVNPSSHRGRKNQEKKPARKGTSTKKRTQKSK